MTKNLGIQEKLLGLHSLERKRLKQNTAVVFESVSDCCKGKAVSLLCDHGEQDKKQMVYNLGKELKVRHQEKIASVIDS